MSNIKVIVSNNVFTAEDQQCHPLAFSVSNGRILQVVPKSEVDTIAGEADEVIDYGDKFICPGFHDAHEHVMHAALFPSSLATEYPGKSQQDCVEHMIEFSKTRPGNSWLMSHGWRDNLWSPVETPTKESLDEVFPDRPVCMYSGDSHTLWCNSVCLNELGLTDESEPPQGGIFDRDEDGHLTGVLREAAGMKYVCEILAQFDTNELMDVYYDYFNKLLSMGITSVCDMAISLIPGADCILPEVYKGLLNEDKLHVRCHLYPTLSEDMSNLEDLQQELTGGMLQAPGFKQFFDGVSSQHTAWVTEDYYNARFNGDRGKPTVEPKRMRELVLQAASKGHSVRIHTIGDAAVHEAIDIFSQAKDMYGTPNIGANALEHIEDIMPDDINKFKDAGLVASVQPPHATIDITQPARDLGEWRACRMWPFKTFENKGITLALGTDAPVVGPNSLDVLWCAIYRSHPDTHLPSEGWYANQDLSRASAIRAYTYGSAASVGRQDELGLIKKGYLADFVVWDSNLLEIDADKFQHSKVLHTYVDGKLVYEA